MALQFLVAPLGADLRRCLDEQFGVGIRCDHGADVAAVEDGAACLAGEALLALHQRCADERVGGDDGGELADLIAAQRGVGEQRIVKVAGGDGVGLFGGVEFQATDGQRHGAVQQPGVEVRQAVMTRESLGDGALARCGGAVDGDDHAASPPSRPVSSSSD